MKNQRTSIFPYLLTASLGVIAGLVSFFPLKEVEVVGELGASYIGLFLGLATILITDRVFFDSKLNEVEANLAEVIENSRLFEGSQQTFKSTRIALEYLNGQLPKAHKIWNTRLQTATNAPALKGTIRLVESQDKLISQQILEGATFEFIFNSDLSPNGSDYFLKQYKKNRSSKGQLLMYGMNNCGPPLLQMTILEYADGSREAFVGWIFNRKANVAGVWLTRDPEASAFFISVFNAYKINAELIENT